jgi:hypothetical protein
MSEGLELDEWVYKIHEFEEMRFGAHNGLNVGLYNWYRDDGEKPADSVMSMVYAYGADCYVGWATLKYGVGIQIARLTESWRWKIILPTKLPSCTIWMARERKAKPHG